MGGGGREKFATGVDESPLDLDILKPIERGSRDDQHVVLSRYQILMTPEKFTHAAFGPVALDGVAHRGPGSHHANAGSRLGFARHLGRSPDHPKRKGAAIMAAPFFTNVAEIRLAPQTLLGAKLHDGAAFTTP